MMKSSHDHLTLGTTIVSRRNLFMKPEIIFEDRHILVCIKPAGVPVQSRQVTTPDMVSLLKNHLRSSHPGKREPYLGLIHRLDQPVEGLLVFAKTPAAARALSRQLQSSGFGKRYLALLSAVPPQTEATLEDYIVKNGRTNTSRICTPDTPGGKPARLHYKVLSTQDACALAGIILDTGRHHQIRVQMAHIGCPIVGDRKYGQSSHGSHPPMSGQLRLYASSLSFLHPATGEPLTFHHTPDIPLGNLHVPWSEIVST